MDTASLKHAVNKAKQALGQGALKHEQIVALLHLSYALCGRFETQLPRYRTIRGQYRVTTDLSRIMEALLIGLDRPINIASKPTIKTNRLRYLFTLRRYRTPSNNKNLLTVLRQSSVGSTVSFSEIKDLTNLEFALTSTEALCPEQRPYWFGPMQEIERLFDTWANGDIQPIEQVVHYATARIYQILK